MEERRTMSRTQRRAALTTVTTGAFDKTPETSPATAAPGRAKSTGPRAGKRAVPFWMPEAAKRQLDLMVVEQDTTKQAVLTEAINDLFKKYGKPPIA
jgi:hypothetical protein